MIFCIRETKTNCHGQRSIRKNTMTIDNLNIELRKKLVRCYIRSTTLYGSKTGVEVFGGLRNVELEENRGDKTVLKGTNEEILECVERRGRF